MTNSHSFSVFVGIKPANRVWCINTGGKLCYDIEYTVERTIAPQAIFLRPTLHVTVIFVPKTLSKALKHTVWVAQIP